MTRIVPPRPSPLTTTEQLRAQGDLHALHVLPR